jgi:ribonuclease HI
MDQTIILNFDGGSRGNPGVAGIGVVLCAQDGIPIFTLGRHIGRATNNVAEYTALLVGLREAAKLGVKKILVRGDSELVIKQMRGEYRVKNAALKDLYGQAASLIEKFSQIKFEHNLRHHNSLADKLANLAMDRKADVTDVDEVSLPPASADSNMLSCLNCGCQIEVIKRPGARAKGGRFICPCGSSMD